MKRLLLLVPLLLSGCFYEYVYVRDVRPILPLEDIQQPDLRPLAAVREDLDPQVSQSLDQLFIYSLQLRKMVEEYNRLAEEHNAEATAVAPE